ncbi:MAG: tRNA guanosine(15) transglycosylase TgtA [Thermoplasmatales archaeon]|nr:tRNA guanosine(15) transglycosylase TgtA [Thermoplasmatales archaeon]
MGDFELLERDGLARIGRLATPHGPLETPALLPVVHPDPGRQPIPPREIRRRFGLGAFITSSYIAYRSPELRERALASGIHGLIDFDGPVMTDSGAFQQHAYGHVEVGPTEILEFQNRIGTDIATVLDVFVEPSADHGEAEAGVRLTSERARAARKGREGLLAVPVQGGTFADLRAESALEASAVGDILAVGGVVPLWEQYRFPELADAVVAARPYLSPAGVVHLFGTGHPMTFAFGALLGVDLYDSSAYHKFARRDRLLLPEGTVPLDQVRENWCQCTLCGETTLAEVATLPDAEREIALARHNLLVSAEEMARVRQSIRDGTLWELAERRATAHPALLAGLRTLKDHPEVFRSSEPESRRTYRETGIDSFRRPAVDRWRERLERFLAPTDARRPVVRRVPLEPNSLARIPPNDASGSPLGWSCPTPFGPVPIELIETYPVGPALAEAEFVHQPDAGPMSVKVFEDVSRALGREYPWNRDWVAEWTRRQVAALLRFRYGDEVAGSARARAWIGERSRRTGRLRTIREEDRVLFQIGNDGIPRPTFAGAQWLVDALPEGRERVVVDADAAPFVGKGRSLFSRFVRAADPTLAPGSSALLVDPDGGLLAVGRLLLAPHEMGVLRRGIAVRVTAHRHVPAGPVEELGPDEL